MRKWLLVLGLVVFIAFGFSGAWAESYLFDYSFNLNGVFSNNALPGGATGSFDASGLGSITINYNPGAAGTYTILGFFDHEINELANGFTNETGSVSGAVAAGQSWQIDEPGYTTGTIYDNFLAGVLDNTNHRLNPDDVSMAMGWTFTLGVGESARITFDITGTAPGGFYTSQIDGGTGETIYLASSMRIDGGGPQPVPEPATLLLLGSGLVGLIGFRKRFGK